MPTITYSFEPNQNVYIITTASDGAISIRNAVVLRFRAEALVTGVKQAYDVRYPNQTSTVVIDVNDIFATLNDALTEYEARLV